MDESTPPPPPVRARRRDETRVGDKEDERKGEMPGYSGGERLRVCAGGSSVAKIYLYYDMIFFLLLLIAGIKF